MQNILAITLQSMQQDSTRLERVGMNLANALTPGYKREVVSIEPQGFADQISALARPTTQASKPQASSGVAGVQIQSDVRPGTLKSTGQSLDIGIAGPGYFEIITPAGPAYTRQGNFHLDNRGRLVTMQGYPVMGKGGEIVLTTGTPSIDSQGKVFEGFKSALAAAPTGPAAEQQAVAQLKLVQLEHPETAQRLGEGLIVSAGAGQLVNEADIQLRQGFLENSNVSSMHEMVQLMQTMRHFESMQKVALGYDEMMGTAIRKLGELS